MKVVGSRPVVATAIIYRHGDRMRGRTGRGSSGMTLAPSALREIERGPKSVPILFEHDRSRPIGTATGFKVTEAGDLVCELTIDGEHYDELQLDELDGVSAGFRYERRRDRHGVMVATSALLEEVSVVREGAWAGSKILDRRRLRGVEMSDVVAAGASSFAASALCVSDGRRCSRCSTATRVVTHHER
jgi:HK97 family phage prohead protease